MFDALPCIAISLWSVMHTAYDALVHLGLYTDIMSINRYMFKMVADHVAAGPDRWYSFMIKVW